MAMNINNIPGNRNNAIDNNRQQEQNKVTSSRNNARNDAVPAQQDSVMLTDRARQLSQIEQGLKQGGDYDNSQKIAALKQAVADGSYQINAPRVAQKMGSMEDQLNTLYR